MTIFEQVISNTEVQMAMSIHLGALLYALFVFPILVHLIVKLTPTSDNNHKGNDNEKENDNLPNIIVYTIGTLGIIGIFAFYGLIIFITLYAVLGTVHFIPPLQKPATDYLRENSFINSVSTKNIDKPIFSEKYSNEIAEAAHSKLSDFDLDMCGAPKDKEHTTILCGGNNTDPVTATKDDKYYTLTPIIKTHHDSIFHGDTAIVTLNVDIKEK